MTTVDPTTPVRDDVTVKIPAWLAKNEDYASCELAGQVIGRTAKAVRLRAHAVVRPSDHCLRCGREITNPVSRLAGYGPYCSDRLGIPRDFTEDQIAEIRAQVEAIVTEVWLPLSRVEVLAGTLDVELPAPDRAGDDEVPRPAPVGEPASPARPPSGERLRLAVVDGRLACWSPFRVKDDVKAIPGRQWDKKSKAWTFPISATSARALVDLAETARLELRVEETARTVVESAATQDAAQAHKAAVDLPEVPSKTDAWHHQRQAFWFARELPAAMLAMDMGTGKSKVAVDLVCDREAARTLILCPRSVLGVWPREFARHGKCRVVVQAPRKGTIARRVAAIEQDLDQLDGVTPVVVVVNYEAAWRDPMAKLLLSTEWDLVVLDESHRVKAPGGKASMFCASLRTRAASRLCLTGTPMPHSPLDVYAQYRFLDPGIFGTSFAAFRARYAVMGGYGGHEVVTYRITEKNPDGSVNTFYDERLAREFDKRMYDVGFRVMADDVLDLPEAIHEYRTTELKPAAKKIYRELASDLFSEVDAGTITAANALVRLLRLQQATSGHAVLDGDSTDDGERTVVEIGTEKRDLLADTIEDVAADEPIVVFCRFTHDLDSVRSVAEEQGRRYGELSGRRRDGLADDATMSADVDVLGVQIQAGGVGVDLTRARYCVFYSVGFSLGDYDQALRRVHRPGQERPVTYYHLLCEDTVDERVYEALRQRKDLVEYVLSDDAATAGRAARLAEEVEEARVAASLDRDLREVFGDDR